MKRIALQRLHAAILALLILCVCHATSLAQGARLSLMVEPVSHGRIVALGDTLQTDAQDYFVTDLLKFYLSGIRLLQNDSLVWTDTESSHLYDLSEAKPFELQISQGLQFNTIRFYIGIDSLTNVSGAMGGDLDPVKGMYWSWQSGYINFKTEGRSNTCNNPKKEFQLHLGGYMTPDKVLQEVNLQVQQKPIICLQFDLLRFLLASDLQKRSYLMSPGPAAVKLSGIAAQCFKAKLL